MKEEDISYRNQMEILTFRQPLPLLIILKTGFSVVTKLYQWEFILPNKYMEFQQGFVFLFLPGALEMVNTR